MAFSWPSNFTRFVCLLIQIPKVSSSIVCVAEEQRGGHRACQLLPSHGGCRRGSALNERPSDPIIFPNFLLLCLSVVAKTFGVEAFVIHCFQNHLPLILPRVLPRVLRSHARLVCEDAC